MQNKKHAMMFIPKNNPRGSLYSDPQFLFNSKIEIGWIPGVETGFIL